MLDKRDVWEPLIAKKLTVVMGTNSMKIILTTIKYGDIVEPVMQRPKEGKN